MGGADVRLPTHLCLGYWNPSVVMLLVNLGEDEGALTR